jgi:hypothetical protein
LSSVEETSTVSPDGSRRYAIASWRVVRKLCAWALPRDSASASAKFAKSTVKSSKIAKAAW